MAQAASHLPATGLRPKALNPKPRVRGTQQEPQALLGGSGGPSKWVNNGGYIGIMEKKMETTIAYWGYIRIMEKKMEPNKWVNNKDNLGSYVCYGG